MTFRAITLGLLGVASVCGFGYFNDWVMRQTYFVGNHMPFSVYGCLVLFLLIGRPLLARISKRLFLSNKEIAVILTLTLCACCIPGSAFMRILHPCLMLPHHYVRTVPGWESADVINLTPKRMLADPSLNESEALNGFVQGLSDGADRISPGEIPWYAWTRTLAFWLPLAMTLWIALISLALVVHRQWARNEMLPYPVAGFARSLMEGDPHDGKSVFKKNLFWAGLITVLLINLNNYGCAWFPQTFIPVQVRFPTDGLQSLLELFPTFKAGGGWRLLWLSSRLYFTAMAVAFFLPTDISFSAGISPFLVCFAMGIMARYGIPFDHGSYVAASPGRLLYFGAFLGVFLSFLYTGRHYYRHVLGRAIGLRSREDVGTASVWGLRIFAVAIALFILQTHLVGLDWHLGIVFSLLAVIFFLVMGRVIAESGIFFFQPRWFVSSIFIGAFGVEAVGLQNMIIILLFSVLLVTDGRETLMSYVVNAFKLVDSTKASVGRVAPWCVVALLVGLTVAVPTTLYFQYDLGAQNVDGWGGRRAPQFTYNEIIIHHDRMLGNGTLETSKALSGLNRLSLWRPRKDCLTVGLLAMVLVFVLVFCRMRFPWWPLHPIVLLIGIGYAGCTIAGSFLIGWFLRVLVMKYGGVASYHKVRVMMFGVIAGDMLGGFIPFLIGLAYYLFTGEPPRQFYIMPG